MWALPSTTLLCFNGCFSPLLFFQGKRNIFKIFLISNPQSWLLLKIIKFSSKNLVSIEILNTVLMTILVKILELNILILQVWKCLYIVLTVDWQVSWLWNSGLKTNLPWNFDGIDSLTCNCQCCFWDVVPSKVFAFWHMTCFFFFFSSEAFKIFYISPNYLCKVRRTTPNIDLFCWEHKATPSPARKM